MLMFRSRRNTLVKRLWKARLGGSDEEGREVRKWLLRRLAEDQLDILVNAIESRGGGTADCLLIEPVEECTSPELLCCQIWRWPDLDSIKQLKKLPMCKSGVGSTCCNPYHWSRLCLPESPPPPYSRFSSERLKPEDRAPSESTQIELRGSLSTNGEETDSSERSDMDVHIEEIEDFGYLMGQLRNCTEDTSTDEEELDIKTADTDTKQYNMIECNDILSNYNMDAIEKLSEANTVTNQVHLASNINKNRTTMNSNNTTGIIDKHIDSFDKYNDISQQLITEEELDGKQWCRLAYWELSSRVGRQYPVESSYINVFWSTPHGDGLCLATLAMHSFSPPNIVRRTREKIGEGITLSREEDGVWAYNRSDCPLFVNSPALDDQESKLMIVYRIPPGHCLNIYSEAARSRLSVGSLSRPHIGPIDANSVRISFAKGWGPKYSRQEVTSCPTWLEVLLAPCR